jgi:hypothetical protein
MFGTAYSGPTPKSAVLDLALTESYTCRDKRSCTNLLIDGVRPVPSGEAN